MPSFNEWGLVPLKPSQPPSSPVSVSSSELLRDLSDDDDVGEYLVEGSPRSLGPATRSGGIPLRRLRRATKGDAVSLPRGGASTFLLAATITELAAAHPSALGGVAELVPKKLGGAAPEQEEVTRGRGTVSISSCLCFPLLT